MENAPKTISAGTPNSIPETKSAGSKNFFDAHAHLPSEEFFSKKTLPKIDENFRGIVCATREREFENLAKIAAAFPRQIVPAFGLHPWFLNEKSTLWAENLKKFLRAFPSANVGEIGLDKAFFDKISAAAQCEIFEIQLEIAFNFRRKTQIHCVGAWGEMTRILRARKIKKSLPELHFHCFSGSAEIAKELEKLGATFSFPREKIENPTSKIAKILEQISAEKIFFESDAAVPAAA